MPDPRLSFPLLAKRLTVLLFLLLWLVKLFFKFTSSVLVMVGSLVVDKVG